MKMLLALVVLMALVGSAMAVAYPILTQSGTAYLAAYSINGVDRISGDASAYQNLGLYGEFDKASASFDNSMATVGTESKSNELYDTNNRVTTELSPGNLASINAADEVMNANMGAMVTADIQQQGAGSGWLQPTDSGGIDMWALIGASDSQSSIPINSTVSGSAETDIYNALYNASPNISG